MTYRARARRTVFPDVMLMSVAELAAEKTKLERWATMGIDEDQTDRYMAICHTLEQLNGEPQ